ncbi:MAG: T9SS type A sorting domain-containing protein [Saprospiraceae bacterium]
MKKNLLFLLLAFFTTTLLVAQQADSNKLVADASVVVNRSAVKVKVYPNPASNFIGLRYKGSAVKELVIYNLLGKKMKSFLYNADQTYNIASLPKGMYLVRIIGHDNKVIKTQRLSKR